VRIFLVLAFLVLGSQPVIAGAAGFDCAKAATKVEQRICADAALSKLDDELSGEYHAAMLRTGAPAELKRAQAQWLKGTRDKCATRACLGEAYRQRMVELKRNVAVFPDATSAVIGACESLAKVAGADATNCRVIESGSFGTVDDRDQRYAIYCLDNGGDKQKSCDSGGLAAFEVDARTQMAARWLHRVDAEASGDRFAKPELIRTKGPQLLLVPVSVPGTGAFNASQLFRRDAGRWIEVDTASWQKELAAQLPKGLAVWKGIWPDYRTMSAQTGLYRAKDANCCATGGIARIALKLDGNRLALVSFKILPPQR
jgi:uncharacterized protein